MGWGDGEGETVIRVCKVCGFEGKDVLKDEDIFVCLRSTSVKKKKREKEAIKSVATGICNRDMTRD